MTTIPEPPRETTLYICARSDGARKAFAAATFEASSRSVAMLVLGSLDDQFYIVQPEGVPAPVGYIVAGLVEPNGTIIGA